MMQKTLLLATLALLQVTAAFVVQRQRNTPYFREYNQPIDVSKHQFATTVAPTTTSLGAAIQKGDTILVVGGTGGVGQLVASKLAARGDFKVRATSRDANKGREILANDSIDVVALDLVVQDDTAANQALQDALRDVSAVVIAVGTTAFPTKKWANGNNPKAIDEEAVKRLAQAAVKQDSLKKIVLLTSVGVTRTKEFPFVILNLFGVLDAKRNGEEAVKAATNSKPNCDYAILRPGRLIGGPFTNLDVATLLKIEGGAENGVDIQLGDTLLGDCKRDACAEAVVQCLLNEKCANVAFSIVSNDQKALTDEEWTKLFQNIR